MFKICTAETVWCFGNPPLHPTSQEEEPDTPARCPKTAARSLANGTRVEASRNEAKKRIWLWQRLWTNWAVATTRLLTFHEYQIIMIYHGWIWMFNSQVNRDPYNGSFWSLQFQFNCVTVVFHLYRTKSPRCTDPWEDSCLMKSWLLGWVMSLHSPQNWKVTLFQETSPWSPNNNRTSPLQSRISWSKGHLRLFGRVSFTQIQPHNSALWPVSINHPKHHSQTFNMFQLFN